MVRDDVEDYLKTLFFLEQDTWAPVPTSTIAKVAPIEMSLLDHDDGRVQLPESIAEATQVFDGDSNASPPEVTES